MFGDHDLISSGDPTPPDTQKWANTRRDEETWKQTETHKQKERGWENLRGRKKGVCTQGKDIKRKTGEGRECKRKWEWATQWGAGEWGERKEKELRKGEGECFYPHVHSVRGVSEFDCSWTACQNSVATTASIHLHPTLKCMHICMCKCMSLRKLLIMLVLKP